MLNEEKTRAAAEGKEILMRRLKNWKIPYGDGAIQKLIDHYNLKTAQDLYYLIQAEKIELLEIKEVLLTEEELTRQTQTPASEIRDQVPEPQYSDFLVIENKVEGLDYKLARCCNPVPGDAIFGFITIAEGIKIHRTGCPNSQYMISKFPYRVVAARWTQSKSGGQAFVAAIKISGIDQVGIVNRIADVLSESKVIIRSFNYTMDEGMFEGMLQIMVFNNTVLQLVIKRILAIKGILKVSRSDN
jgi:GTP pyrophosphokinase